MDDDTKKMNNLVLVFVVVQVLFVGLCVATLSRVLVNDNVEEGEFARLPSITIDGLSETLVDATEEDTKVIEWMLLDTVKKNMSEVDFGSIKGVVRSESVKTYYFGAQKIYYYSAVIDVPEIRQSYRVVHEYSDEQDNEYLSANEQYIILCLSDLGEIRYAEFDCKSDYDKLTYNTIVMKYIWYFDFEEFVVRSVSGDYSKIRIIALKDDYNGDVLVKKVKEAIRGLGVSPDLFEYEVAWWGNEPNFQYFVED